MSTSEYSAGGAYRGRRRKPGAQAARPAGIYPPVTGENAKRRRRRRHLHPCQRGTGKTLFRTRQNKTLPVPVCTPGRALGDRSPAPSRSVRERQEPLSLYVMLWRGACPRVTARSGRGTAQGVVPAPSCRTPLRPGSGCCRLCLTLPFRLRRNRGTLPRRQTPAVQNRPAKPYPNTNIVLLYTRRAVLSTGSFERIPKRRKVCAIRRCAVPIPRAIRAFFRRLLTAADAAG